MNDCLRTDAFVRFPPETIACSCIYLAARILRVSVKCDLRFTLAAIMHPGALFKWNQGD